MCGATERRVGAPGLLQHVAGPIPRRGEWATPAGYGIQCLKQKKLLDYVNQNTALGLETKREWIYEDVHTGSDLARPKLQALLEDVKKGKFDAVLVWKIDRLSRSLKHLLGMFEIFEKNIRLWG